jgi:hypothetical protein
MANTSYGADRVLVVRTDTSSLVRWDLSRVPANATVVEACLVLTVEDPSFRTFQAFELKRFWSESDATWKNYTGASPWGAPGATDITDRGSVAVATFQWTAAGTFGTPLSAALVQKWVANASSNNGFVIANSAANDTISFLSSQSGPGPALQIGYN